jgi:transcriptional regulator NrdR family protein
MLCPDCLDKKQKTVRLNVMDSRPDGPYKRHRKYHCPKCNFETWTTEILPEPVFLGKNSAFISAS